MRSDALPTLAVLFLLILTGISFTTPINNCSDINSPGTYELTASLSGAGISASPRAGLDSACIRISVSNVAFDCQGYGLVGNGSNYQGYGVLILSSTAGTLISNVTVKNCAPIARYYYGIMSQNSSNAILNNNTIFNLTSGGSMGVWLINGSNSVVSNNNISYFPTATTSSNQAGVYLTIGSNNNTIANNLIYNINSTGSGACFGILANYYGFAVPCANNTISGNTIRNINGAGVAALDNSVNQTIRDNNISRTNSAGILLSSSNLTQVINNSIFNSSADCLRMDTSNNATAANNSITYCGSSSSGILIQTMNGGRITNNTVSYSYDAILASSTTRTIFQDNLLANGTRNGIFIWSASNNDNITNNTIRNFSSHGIYMTGPAYTATFHAVSNNTIFNNSMNGIYFLNIYSNSIKNNSIFNNTQNGIKIDSGYSASQGFNNITDCRVFDNGGNGIYVMADSSGIVNNTVLYRNAGNALVFDSSNNQALRLFNVIFDGPLGNLTNFTNISMNDTLSGSSAYSMNWSAEPAAPPFPSLAGKYLNITKISGATVSLDTVVLHWLDSEAAGHSENNFTIYKYNSSGWTKVPALLNPAANTLTVTNLAGFSDFGILEGNESQVNCPTITAPGAYLQDKNYSGAPNSGSPVLDYGCVVISSSNVTWDCNGFGIANNGTAGATSAIIIGTGLTNVTVKNCNGLSNYSYGIFAYNSGNSSLTNNSASSNSNAGIRLVNSTNFTVSRNTIYNSSFNSTGLGAIHLYNSNLSLFINNSVYNNTNGFVLDYASNNNIFSNNSVHDNTQNGFLLNNLTAFDTGENLSGNTIFNNAGYGVNVYDSNRTTLTEDRFYNNSVDLYINHTSAQRVFNLSYVIFDSPPGGYTNYTNLSVNDTSALSGSNRYTFNWSANPGSLPAGNVSFANKYVTIIRINGTLDKAVWHWLDSELGGGDNESKFKLFNYSGGSWALKNSTPDIGSNTLTHSNFVPTGIYGIMEDGVPPPPLTCPLITSPGVYNLTQNAIGAPYDGAPVFVYACVKIASSNVIFDCLGYNITNNGTDQAVGILLNGSLTNVTVRNCGNISGYQRGVYIYRSNGNTLSNLSVYNSTSSGFFMVSSSSNNITGNTVYEPGFYGFYAYNGTGNRFMDNIAYHATGTHFYLETSTANVVSNNTAQGSLVGYGYNLDSDSDSNILTNNRAITNFVGYYVYSGAGNTLQDNIAADNQNAPNSGGGFWIGTDNNIIINNTASGSYRNIRLVYGTGNVLINNTARDGNGEGIFVSASLNNFTGNKAFNNTGNGFYFWPQPSGPDNPADNNILNDNEAYGNGVGLNLRDAYDNSINRMHLYGNTQDFRATEGASSMMTYVAIDMVFDRPAGDHQEFSNMTIIDTLNSESYAMTWAALPAPLPGNQTSFENKYVDIAPLSGSPSLDSVMWSWTDAEAVPYNEPGFSIWEYTGTWTNLTAGLDIIGNTIFVNDLVPASGYAILDDNSTGEINFTLIQLYGANVTNSTQYRWGGNSSGNLSTEGGNITASNISATMLTDRWAAFFGNITGGILLADSANAIVYTWNWTPANGGVICVSTNSTLSVINATGGKRAEIDTAWGFSPLASDSANNTFLGSGCALDFNGVTVGDADSADTGLPGGFITCAYKSEAVPAKQNLLFCGNITQNGIFYNGESGDFELIAPTAFGSGTETYYFYMSLP